MIDCLIINNNEFNKIKVRNLNEDNIYKKCNYKNNLDFMKIMNMDYDNNILEVWGKVKCKTELNKNIFLKNNNLECYGKAIILLKNNEEKYINLDTNKFFKKFKINNDLDNSSNDNNINEINDNNNNIIVNVEENKKIDTNSESSEMNESELEYELYCYTSDEE